MFSWKKNISCSEKSEGTTIGIPLKKTSNFVRKRLQYCEIYKNTRSSHQRCSIIKGVLINFAKFTGKHLCQSLFLNKVAGTRPMICQGLSAIFIITNLQHKSCNIFIIKHFNNNAHQVRCYISSSLRLLVKVLI